MIVATSLWRGCCCGLPARREFGNLRLLLLLLIFIWELVGCATLMTRRLCSLDSTAGSNHCSKVTKLCSLCLTTKHSLNLRFQRCHPALIMFKAAQWWRNALSAQTPIINGSKMFDWMRLADYTVAIVVLVFWTISFRGFGWSYLGPCSSLAALERKIARRASAPLLKEECLIWLPEVEHQTT